MIRTLWLIALVIISLILIPIGYVQADTYLTAIGDLGCKSVAKNNLNNIATSKLPLLGAGDYLYNCKTSDIQPYWDKIEVKHGPPGNHEYDKQTSYDFAKKIMGIGDKGWFSWKLSDIAIIGINQYKDYKIGSEQHNYILAKLKQFSNRNDINWILVAFHEPIYTPTVSGGHGPLKDFRDIYGPIFKNYLNLLVLQGHNHITAFGTVNDIHNAMCGGGGKGGDSVGKLNGYALASDTFGYCLFHFQKDKAMVQLIDVNGDAVEMTYPNKTKTFSHTWSLN